MDLTDLSKLTPGEFRGASRKLKCTYGAEVTLHGGPEWPRLAEKKLNSEKSVFLEALNGCSVKIPYSKAPGHTFENAANVGMRSKI
ncbi:hypothetical protein RB195_009685 [Necator americanus]|uniref:Uncharacterized protein n=1 Tax=Necator americanus TaxID=51031 RepID=A0ABR1CUE5_NECAM